MTAVLYKTSNDDRTGYPMDSVRQCNKVKIMYTQLMEKTKPRVHGILLKKVHWLLIRILPIQRKWREGVKGYAWFDELWNDLFIGGVPYREADYSWMMKNDIQAVLNTTSEWLDNEEYFREKGISYLHIPVPDLAAPSQEQLTEAVGYIRSHLNQEEKVLVHCAKGRGRSATIICAYLAQFLNKTPSQVIAQMKQIRPLVSMSEKQIRSVSDYLNSSEPNGH